MAEADILLFKYRYQIQKVISVGVNFLFSTAAAGETRYIGSVAAAILLH